MQLHEHTSSDNGSVLRAHYHAHESSLENSHNYVHLCSFNYGGFNASCYYITYIVSDFFTSSRVGRVNYMVDIQLW